MCHPVHKSWHFLEGFVIDVLTWQAAMELANFRTWYLCIFTFKYVLKRANILGCVIAKSHDKVIKSYVIVYLSYWSGFVTLCTSDVSQ